METFESSDQICDSFVLLRLAPRIARLHLADSLDKGLFIQRSAFPVLTILVLKFFASLPQDPLQQEVLLKGQLFKFECPQE